MAHRQLNLDVAWPDGRVVAVEVRVLPLVGLRREERERELAEVHAIDGDQLHSKEVFEAFLRSITTGEPNGGVVRAACFEPDLTKLLERVGVSGPPPSRIRVRLSTA